MAVQLYCKRCVCVGGGGVAVHHAGLSVFFFLAVPRSSFMVEWSSLAEEESMMQLFGFGGGI